MKKRILYLVQDDWFFLSHRLPVATAAQKAGFEVHVACRVHSNQEEIHKAGFKLHPLHSYSKRSTSPFSIIHTIREVRNILKKIKPDILHNVALKPVVLGSLAARGLRNIRVINAYTGLGFVFSDDILKARILRVVTTLGMRILFPHGQITNIFQNRDDLSLMESAGVVKGGNSHLIRGSGVDTDRFEYSEEMDGTPVIILASRMLWNKGVGDFVKAISMIKQQQPAFKAVLAGGLDLENPVGIEAEKITQWVNEGLVEYVGHQEDLATWFMKCHIVCLPSYREGLPKVLLEAAACGRAIVTTDVPGCREIVQYGINGLLVPREDPVKLAKALKLLLLDPELRKSMGRKGKELVDKHFTADKVGSATLEIYQRLLQT